MNWPCHLLVYLHLSLKTIVLSNLTLVGHIGYITFASEFFVFRCKNFTMYSKLLVLPLQFIPSSEFLFLYLFK